MNPKTQKHTKGIKVHQSKITNYDLWNPLKLNICFLRGLLR